MRKSIKLDVFGKHILSKRTNEGWSIFYLSDNGKIDYSALDLDVKFQESNNLYKLPPGFL